MVCGFGDGSSEGEGNEGGGTGNGGGLEGTGPLVGALTGLNPGDVGAVGGCELSGHIGVETEVVGRGTILLPLWKESSASDIGDLSWPLKMLLTGGEGGGASPSLIEAIDGILGNDSDEGLAFAIEGGSEGGVVVVVVQFDVDGTVDPGGGGSPAVGGRDGIISLSDGGTHADTDDVVRVVEVGGLGVFGEDGVSVGVLVGGGDGSLSALGLGVEGVDVGGEALGLVTDPSISLHVGVVSVSVGDSDLHNLLRSEGGGDSVSEVDHCDVVVIKFKFNNFGWQPFK